VDVLPWGAVRVHDLTGDDLGMALVPMPIKLGNGTPSRDTRGRRRSSTSSGLLRDRRSQRSLRCARSCCTRR